MKGFLGFLLFALAIIGLLYTFSGKEYIPVPGDDIHKGVPERACMDCHGPGKKDQLKSNHPPKYECMKCHKRGG